MAVEQDVHPFEGLYVCGLCGELVTGKRIWPGRTYPMSGGGWARYIDRLAENMPCGHDALAISMLSDAECLRRTAVVLKRRSRRPDGWLLNVFCRVLDRTADKMEAES